MSRGDNSTVLSSLATVLPESNRCQDEIFGNHTSCPLYKEMVPGEVFRAGFTAQVTQLLINSRESSLPKSGLAFGAAIGDALLDSVISKHVKSDLAKEVFAPNIFEAMGIGLAVSRLPKNKWAAGIAVGAWAFGRTENYLEYKYHIEEKLAATSHRACNYMWNTAAGKAVQSEAQKLLGP
jgi:hypothetical protein